MSDNDVYLALVDDVWRKIEEQKPKSRDDVMEIVDRISNDILEDINEALFDIQNDYCEEKGLEWEDEQKDI